MLGGCPGGSVVRTRPIAPVSDGVRVVSKASASDFGSPDDMDDDDQVHDEHDPASSAAEDLNGFFQRAFGGRGAGPARGFGMHAGPGPGGFQFYSSAGGGFGHGGYRGGRPGGSREEEEHNVECSQM